MCKEHTPYPFLCCRGTETDEDTRKQKAARMRLWTLDLEKAARMCLSDHYDRHFNLKQRTKGVRALENLVRRMKKDAEDLEDHDLTLLLRCCLYSLKHFTERVEHGEFLMRHWMKIAKSCYINTLYNLHRSNAQIAAISVIRFLQDDDRWRSCDFGIEVVRVLMQVFGEMFITEVEEQVLSVFINFIIPFCPGMNESLSSDFVFVKSHSYIIHIDDIDTTAIVTKNPLLSMSRVLHGVLSDYKFKDFGNVGWITLNVLISIYINVVRAIEVMENKDEQSSGNMSKEWGMTESALIGCLRNFLDDIVSSDLRFKVLTERSFSIFAKEEKVKPLDEGSTSVGWDILSQFMIVVLERTIGSEVPQIARNQLLDMLINATRKPLGFRHLALCLPEKLLTPLLEVARVGDPGATLRSHKLLHHIIDRHNFRSHFVSPRIFPEKYSAFNNIRCEKADWDHLKSQRKNLYETIYRNFLTTTNILNNLEVLYCTICLILVETGCIPAARDIAELMVNIQDIVIGNPNIPVHSPRVSAWIHSTVISVISLISCIHQIEELHTLVNETVKRRSQVAPFLIPPLKAKHTIGDITDFQENLFFSHALITGCFAKVKPSEYQARSKSITSNSSYTSSKD